VPQAVLESDASPRGVGVTMDLDRAKFWNAAPYPHLAIDGFFDQTFFEHLSESMRLVSERGRASHQYNDEIQRNKQCFDNRSFDANIFKAVEHLSGSLVTELEDLLDVKGLIPLTALKELSGRTYFHVSSGGGVLGSHVDQSVVGRRWFRRWMFKKNIHVVSCVFYGSPEWRAADGGHTILFDQSGEHAVTQVECRPNRLNIFLHTSRSFHGVSELTTTRKRYSIYMDYYLPPSGLPMLKESIVRNRAQCAPDYWMHPVVFVPKSGRPIYQKIWDRYIEEAARPL
jgi:hypothetical protein